MNCLSLYSGADNLGDGVIQAGHKVKLAIEINTDACKTIKLNHPDIEVINGKVSDYLSTLGRYDAVIGGPPCQGFSVANSNRTYDLCEVNNFMAAVVLTKSEFYFMENVSGLFKVHKDNNYLINCADYGVPQTRIRRIFTNLPLPRPSHNKNNWVSVKDALGLDFGIIQDRKTTFGEKKYREYSIDKPSHTIVTDSREWFVNPTGFDYKNAKQIGRSTNKPIMTIVNGNAYQFTDKPKMSKKYPELQNGYKEIRKLTNEELAILQGFRKDFKFYGGKTSVKKQIGNALPAAVSKAFFSVPLITLRGKTQ